MARVVVYSMGYRGDVFPFVPLARELARRGHAVRFVCPHEFHPVFASEPFQCVPSGTDLGPGLLDSHAGYVARWGTRLGGVMLPRLYFDKLTIPFLDLLFEAIDAELASADLLVSHSFPYLVGGPAAERRALPAVVGDLFPMLVPSRFSALPGQQSFGSLLNRTGWSLLRAARVNRLASFGHLRRFRARLGLDVTGWSFFDARLSPLLTVGLFSRHYSPPLPDWPATYEVAGFTPWLGPPDPILDPGVKQFLDAGPPPVVVTLGTNAATAHPELFVRAGRCLEDLGARGLFLTSTREVAARTRAGLHDQHGVWPFAPLGPILGRCRAVVHAGGIATVSAVLEAGVPSVVIPAVTDQIWHARRITRLGVGLGATRHGLAGALATVLNDPGYRERAECLAVSLGQEHGPTAAADLVEAALR